MSLADFTLPTEDIKGSDGKVVFTVRGLSLNDIVQLLQKNRPAMEQVFNEFQEKGDKLLGDDQALVQMLLESVPRLFAQAVARAADEPDQEDVILKLPLSMQVDAFEQIGKLTFDAEGGPKKVLEAVVRVLKGWTDNVNALS